MNENISTQSYWGVVCLHCSRPFRVPARAARMHRSDPADLTDPIDRETVENESAGPNVFLAWCPYCQHEAPYEAGAIGKFTPSLGDAPAQRAVPLERAVGAS